MSDTTSTPLDTERYINLETFKRDGSGVKTPVWAAPLEGHLVVFTAGDSFKVKRLRRNSKCRAAACDMRGKLKGPWHDGEARIVEDPAQMERAHKALLAKYGWQLRLTDFFSALAGRKNKRAFLEISL
jgi:PPOX class probable F420-dependent enzyme